MAITKRSVLSNAQARALERLSSGDFAGAVEVWQSALKNLGQASSHLYERTLCELYLGMTYYRMGLLTNSEETLLSALKLSDELNTRNKEQCAELQGNILAMLARVFEETGDYDRADQVYHEACHAFEDSGNPHRKAEILFRWAQLREQQMDLISAVNLYNRARRTAFPLEKADDLSREAEQAVDRVLKILDGF